MTPEPPENPNNPPPSLEALARGLTPARERRLHAGQLDEVELFEPLDLNTLPPGTLADHEGGDVMLTPELLALVSGRTDFPRELCDRIESELEAHYHLTGTGYGIGWSGPVKRARLLRWEEEP